MATAFREYVCLRGLGNAGACEEVSRLLIELVAPANLSRQGMNYFYRIMHNDEDITDELLEPAEFCKLTNGKYPALWVNFTYDIDSVSVTFIRHLEDELQLLLFSAGLSPNNHPF
jgi:hypothetical protein